MISATTYPSGAMEEPWALRNLPPFPWITTKLLQLCSAPDDEIDVPRLTELIQSDASLSSELLRRANSALFGARCQVSSVDRAVTMIGLDSVKSLALTIGVGSYLQASMKLAVLRRCWRHSLGTALLAQELSESFGVRPDQAYTAGLLHDVGRLGLLVKYPQSYADLLSVVVENGYSLLQSERDLFDVDHCEAGAWLAREWDYPRELVDVFGHHHEDQPADAAPLLRLINCSCRLADSLGFEVVEPLRKEEPARILAGLPGGIRLDAEEIEQLRVQVTEKANGFE